MARKQTTAGRKQEFGLTVPEKECSPEEREKLEKFAMMASLVVFRGQSITGAYRAVYDTAPDAACPPSIYNAPKFRSLIVKLRNAQGMTDEQVKGTLEGFYCSLLANEDAPMKARLQAAAQWQKLRGLEKQREVIEADPDEMAWQFAMGSKKVVVVEAEVD